MHILDKEAEMDDYKKGILVAMQHRLQERIKLDYSSYGLCCVFQNVMKQDGVQETCYPSFRETYKSELLVALPGHTPLEIYWWPISDYEVRREFLQTLLDND